MSVPNKEVYFTGAEKEWIELLQEMGGSYLEAVTYVISYKRDMALMHKAQGNHALFKQLLTEIGEWTDQMEEYDQCLPGNKKIIILK